MNRQRDSRGRFVSSEPVFNAQEPVINHPPEAWRHSVPYPYQLARWDGPWIFVLFLVAGGFAFKLLWVIAGFIALLRVMVFCSFRWPLTTVFFVSFFSGLSGGRRRRRW